MTLSIIPYRKLWLSVSGLLFILSVFALLIWGLNLGIDFTGGSLLESKFIKNRPEISELRTTMTELNFDKELIIQTAGDKNVIFRFQETNEEAHQKIVSKLKEKYPDNFQEEKFESIGSSVGSELKTKAIYSIIIVSIAIIIYIAVAFRKVSYPVPSWKYGFFAVVSLIHDITITSGIFAVLGRFYGVEIGLSFVAAMLTILGYSVNDTIVIFDRIRENLGRVSKQSFAGVVNLSLNETLTRSINTTLTTLLSLAAVYIFGGESIKYFALALLIGIFLGAYSSIFVASPLLVASDSYKREKK